MFHANSSLRAELAQAQAQIAQGQAKIQEILGQTEGTNDVQETDVTAVIPESSGDAQVATKLVIDEAQPWNAWPDPDILPTTLGTLGIGKEGDDLVLLAGEEGDEETVGKLNDNALRQLGWVIQPCPIEFVRTLSPDTQVQVLNERLDDTSDRELSIIIENESVTNIVKGGRGIPPTKEVAQTAYNAMREVYDDKVLPSLSDHGNGRMHLRLMTELERPVTRRKGDALQMGIDIIQDYGLGLQLALYVNRLVCVNGMMAESREFAWRVRSETTADHQLAWLTTGISEVVGAFDNIVKRSQQMAAMEIKGDIPEVIKQYGKAMHFPARYIGRVIEAYENEPDPTQWGILNAFTRVATHTLSGAAQRNIQLSSGLWVQEFDMVNVRLPRPVAASLGAELVGA